MSTERAAFSEQTASTRPSARWQSEIASEPKTRSRWTSPTSGGVCLATRSVRVASSARISIRSFGGSPGSGAPFSLAPPPRSAVHSSPVPKS